MPHSPRLYHRPVKLTNQQLESFIGGQDPALMQEAAYRCAQTLLQAGQGSNQLVRQRVIRFTDEYGIEPLAQLWQQAPANSLPGALWRIYSLAETIRNKASSISNYYTVGKTSHWGNQLLAGVADPASKTEIINTTNQILSGAFTGEFDTALERFAAFARIVASGQEKTAQELETKDYRRSQTLRAQARKLTKTAIELEKAATSWRANTLG
ncbi:MAG: hypothetical protein Q4C74_02730 [Rothia sp. (in: high G+C Gram-positive bacteria)]|nr:hypothetical protein [Rothia sp. (in: high G+C Gram-positive bacteria)]